MRWFPSWSLGVSLPALLVSAATGLLLGLGGYTFHYAEGGSYFSNDPKACVNCHVMQDVYEGWQHASHHAVATCNDCHTPHEFVPKYLSKAENGFWHSKGFTFQDFHEPILIKPKNASVLQANCTGCHSELVADITAHGPGGEGVNCVRCHAAVGHGPPR
jgi:cytochrome c nitrite reductase small subunit